MTTSRGAFDLSSLSGVGSEPASDSASSPASVDSGISGGSSAPGGAGASGATIPFRVDVRQDERGHQGNGERR